MDIRAVNDEGRPLSLADAALRPYEGLAVVPALTVIVTNDPGPAEGVVARLRFDESANCYRVASLTVSAKDVTGQLLRQVRVLDYVRLGAKAGIWLAMTSSQGPAPLAEWFGFDNEPFYAGEMLDFMRKQGPVPSVLRRVALTYRVATMSSEPPAKAVQRDFGIPPRTAAYWIARAREQGFLEGGAEHGEHSEEA